MSSLLSFLSYFSGYLFSVLPLQDLFGGDKVSAVGSVDPIGNFNAMLARRDVDLMDKAINSMQKQIDRCAYLCLQTGYFDANV